MYGHLQEDEIINLNLKREEEKKSRIGSTNISSQSRVRFICLQCYVEEEIPEEVVEYCDAMDDGDLEV